MLRKHAERPEKENECQRKQSFHGDDLLKMATGSAERFCSSMSYCGGPVLTVSATGGSALRKNVERGFILPSVGPSRSWRSETTHLPAKCVRLSCTYRDLGVGGIRHDEQKSALDIWPDLFDLAHIYQHLEAGTKELAFQ